MAIMIARGGVLFHDGAEIEPQTADRRKAPYTA
jgi:hypothetical protein